MPRLRRKLQWSPIAAALCLCAAVVVTACGGGNNPPPSPYPGRLDPIVGQWTAYGIGTGIVSRLSNPFAIPAQSSGKSINYVYTRINNTLTGKMTLTFSVDGDATFGVADSSDIPPASIRMFIWAANDNGSEYSRWWCSTPANLVLGDNQILSCALDPVRWTDVYGHTNAAQFSAALINPFAAGITFGGQDFAGHGVWNQSGSASFRVESFTIQ